MHVVSGAVPAVLGIDSSTSGCKVEVRDLDDGTVLSRGSAPHPATTPPVSEQHPSDWLAAFDAAYAQAGAPDVAAVSVAGQQHGLVVLDERGDVLRPAKLWNDTTSAADADWLVAQLDGGAAAWADAIGSVPVASFTITKLAWLHREQPNVFDRIAKALLPHDWLTSTMTGEHTTDRGDASGTGYWSPADGTYRLDLLTLVGDRDWARALPRVLGPTDTAGTWRNHGDAVVAAGTGDNMAAALALGLSPGDVALSFGTSGTVFAVSSRPVADATGAVAGFADAAGAYLPLVCTLNATKVLDAVARLLGIDAAGLDALALAAPPGSDGLVLLPYFDGERTPNRPHATGDLAGLRSDLTREQLARAAFEGVVCGLLDGLDALDAVGVDTSGTVQVIGGGARSTALTAIVAGLTGRAVQVVDPAVELVAAGAAVQAAAVLAGRDLTETARAWSVARSTTVEPDPAVVTAAPEVRARYAALRDR